MGEMMRPLAFGDLLDWVLEERQAQGTVFGVHQPWQAAPGISQRTLPLFGQHLALPFGPAAGPHTQLAQNIIAAYYAGSRFFELKTVQTLDGADLTVRKPCINAADEGYNVEWSTELQVPQALAEYVKAWFALKLLSREFALGDPEGFIFNMSVGYDYEGICSPKIDSFIEGLKDSRHTKVWQACRQDALANLQRFHRLDQAYIEGISPRVCSAITLSTLHGCPPQEIERIAAYLIKEKGLNTYVKCNPTLLGYEFVKETLAGLGFGYVQFDQHHFLEDLQYHDAVPMFGRLQQLALNHQVVFGVKLTNTFPVDIAQQELPGQEMYLSGRALYPLTIALASKLAKEFAGKLPLSFSGGAEYFNIAKLYEAGIWPITLATTLLKPGGYQRLTQMAETLAAAVAAAPVPALSPDPAKIGSLAAAALEDPRYRKALKPLPSRKLPAKVPLLSCFRAPCQDGCPIDQDIPAYIGLVGEGRYLEALQVITEKNPLPLITGTICSHPCMDRCTRNFYEAAVAIPQTKLAAAQQGLEALLENLQQRAASRAAGGGSGSWSTPVAQVAVVGGGPAGLAAAYFLADQGLEVTIFEKAHVLGGMVSQVIPEFRIARQVIAQDLRLIQAMGIKIVLGQAVESVKALQGQGFKYTVLALGAWQPGRLPLVQGQALNALDFLGQYKENPSKLGLGTRVVVVGGGNTAMDAARAAKRVAGVEKVSLVYRRTRRYMPAAREELDLALAEGVEFQELLSPISLTAPGLTCGKMVLGQPDKSGRPSPKPTEALVLLPADTLICAVGETIDQTFYRDNGILLDEQGKVMAGQDCGTNLPGVYAVGDGRGGPATVVEAIRDSQAAATAILRLENRAVRQAAELKAFRHSRAQIQAKKGLLCQPGSSSESQRCLECGALCENCVQVCPNRANVAVKVPGQAMTQVIHLESLCNQCGNCATFCPYESAPYKDKFTFFEEEEDFLDSSNPGFLLLDASQRRFKIRLERQIFEVCLEEGGAGLSKEMVNLLDALLDHYAYLFKRNRRKSAQGMA